MELRNDGYNYFTHIMYGSSTPYEYKFKELGDGNVEAYERNTTLNQPFYKLITIIRPDGTGNATLNGFRVTISEYLDIKHNRKNSKTFDTFNTKKQFSLILRDDLKNAMIDNRLTMSTYINQAIENQLKTDGFMKKTNKTNK